MANRLPDGWLPRLESIERLIKIGAEVFGVFEPHRKADQPFANTHCCPCFGRQPSVGGRSWVGDCALGIPQIGGNGKELHCIDHLPRCRAPASYLERDDGASPLLLAPGERMVRMVRQSRVVDARNQRMIGQEPRHHLGVGLVGGHTERQRLYPFKEYPSVKWGERRPGSSQKTEDRFDERITPNHRPAKNPSLPVEILRSRMDHQIGPERQRLLYHGGGKTVIDDQKRPHLVGQGADCCEIDQIGERIGRRFAIKEPRPRCGKKFPGSGKVAKINKMGNYSGSP